MWNVALSKRCQGCRLASVLGLLALAAVGVAGMSVQVAASEVEGRKAGDERDVVIVTANKMEENLTDVPQSITVIDEMMLEEKGITSISDIIREIPNMIDGSGPVAKSVSFRGINQSIFTNNNPVVIYVDGVPHIGTDGFDALLVNVERVEILRGPQGTLYGKDAIGAVINIVTRKPANQWHRLVGAEYGSNNFMRGVFGVSGALINDRLYLGLSGQYRREDGWITNDHPNRDSHFNKENDRRINFSLTATPTDQFTARVTVLNEYTREYGVDGFGLPDGARIGDFSRKDAEKVVFDTPTRQSTDKNAQSLALTYDFGPASLHSMTTHKKLKFDASYDSDFGNNPLFDGLTQFWNYEDEGWTQELRLSGGDPRGFRWIAGLYYEDEDRDQPRLGQQFPYYDEFGNFYGNFEMNAGSRTKAETWAVFGQAVFPLGERFELTLGGRYQRIAKEIDLSMYTQPVGASEPPAFVFNADKSWTAFLPRAALSWRFADNWSSYLSYSKGYMPGGFNYFAMAGNEKDNTFEPQRSTNYEWGLKGDFHRGHLAASLFYMDIRDIHVSKAEGIMYVTGNARKAHSRGAELEATYRLLDVLEFSTAVGIISAKYDDYDTGSGDLNGRTIELTPAHTLRAGVAYVRPDGLYGRVDIYNQGKQYFRDSVNSLEEFPKQDMYTLVDAKLGYRHGDWDLYLYGRNLTDKEYVRMYSGMKVISYGEPRTFGGGVRYRF